MTIKRFAHIHLKNVCVHNLKGVDIVLPVGAFIVFTGVSGSGKSSMAFDTIYAEGQRRYIESLSCYARRYVGELAKPDIELAEGLSPTIAIEQKTAGRNPRSCVGTMTEIYDFLRVLYARVADAHCPLSGQALEAQSKESIIASCQKLFAGDKIAILAPYAKAKKGMFSEDLRLFLRRGFLRARIDGKWVELTEEIELVEGVVHDIDIVVDRLKIEQETAMRAAEGITIALEIGSGLCSIVHLDGGKETLFSSHAYSSASNTYYPCLEPQDFSYNSPSGMCPECQGMGRVQQFYLESIINPELSIAQDCCKIATSYATVRYGNIYDNLADMFGFSVHTPWKKLSSKAKEIFLNGCQDQWLRMEFVHPTKNVKWSDYVKWRGVLAEARERYNQAKSASYRKRMQAMMSESACPSCLGSRLKPYPTAATLRGKAIHQLTQMTIKELTDFFQTLALEPLKHVIAEGLIKEIKARLHYLSHVGLHYLTLNRSSPSLSGGEAQRVRLASQIGSGLCGVTYVLDEPSIGLHPRDNARLIETLNHLRDLGNTVIVVEHDEDTVKAADHIVDFGPGAGAEGGRIVAQGDLQTILEHPASLTGQYLSQAKRILPAATRRKPVKNYAIKMQGACQNNLKDVTLQIPLGLFVAITGVSGSGKSTLISHTLYPAIANALHHASMPVGKYQSIKGLDLIDKVIAIDQSPIGRNPRSNPCTYIKLFDEIRALFASLPGSLAKGFSAGRFSFNVKEGSCQECGGMGMVKIDMDFLEDQWVTCSNCNGCRFDSETLAISYKGKTIAEVLDMSVKEALIFFQAIPAINAKLQVLMDVGLHYLPLGQPSPTLSGGEAQRIKLAKELARPSTGKTLYLLDEPTTGLHFHDIHQLLGVLQKLVDKGNSLLVIEHNMDVVKCADWVVDLGPDGGAKGGMIVAEGPPEKIAQKNTPTGEALAKALPCAPINRSLVKKRDFQKPADTIIVKGACQHNLKNIDAQLPKHAITVCCGPSGSGKSSFAFDTIYAEGMRRYTESLSPYARQFIQQMPKPQVAFIEGLLPSIAIEQKATAGNPRSTVGTLTEIYDYLRLIYAHIAVAYCPETEQIISKITVEYVAEKLLREFTGDAVYILSPLSLDKGISFEDALAKLASQGFLRVQLNGVFYEIDTPIPFEKKRKNTLYVVIDRLRVVKKEESRLLQALQTGAKMGNQKLAVWAKDKTIDYNLAFAVESTGKSYPPLTPQSFAFNSREGMCLECEGLGYIYGADLSFHPEFAEMTAKEMLLHFFGYANIKRPPPLVRQTLELIDLFFDDVGILPHVKLRDLSPSSYFALMNGSKKVYTDKKTGLCFCMPGLNQTLAFAGRHAKAGIKETLRPLMDEIICPSCRGSRLQPLASCARLAGVTIGQLCSWPCSDVMEFLQKLSQQGCGPMQDVLQQAIKRLLFLNEIGLFYIALDRTAPSLSNGEAQRIRLARQLGSSLTGVLYVLDEPTTGLHACDTSRLINALVKLKELGNTLLLVEHDPQALELADYMLDFGPGAGAKGGRIVAKGSLSEIKANPASLTGQYLSGEKKIALPKKRRPFKKALQVRQARLHNLQNIDIDLPLGAFTCLTGVSGSGKSTLMHFLLRPALQAHLLKRTPPKYAQIHGLEHFDKLICLDQNPLGQTARSDVGTYVEAYGKIREFWASLPDAKMRGLLPRHFSYNHRKGMCTNCWGMGYKRVQLQFLPPVTVTCDVCQGMRLNPLSLSVTYLGYHLGHILKMSVAEARQIFANFPRILRPLDALQSVGLGYLLLGQEIATLSGGEASRVKLSRELAKRSSGRTLYLFDEPTTGLHSQDIDQLLQIFQRLCDKGNTLIVIEHNLDVIKCADYIVDLGPGAGSDGGQVVATGSPEQIARHKTSALAPFLKQALKA